MHVCCKHCRGFRTSARWMCRHYCLPRSHCMHSYQPYHASPFLPRLQRGLQLRGGADGAAKIQAAGSIPDLRCPEWNDEIRLFPSAATARTLTSRRSRTSRTRATTSTTTACCPSARPSASCSPRCAPSNRSNSTLQGCPMGHPMVMFLARCPSAKPSASCSPRFVDFSAPFCLQGCPNKFVSSCVSCAAHRPGPRHQLARPGA